MWTICPRDNLVHHTGSGEDDQDGILNNCTFLLESAAGGSTAVKNTERSRTSGDEA